MSSITSTLLPPATSAYAIILAGGSSEQFWPMATPARPKQFLDIFGGKALIRHAVDRLEGLIPSERIYIITPQEYVPLTRETLPMLPPDHIIGEPCRRGTAAAVALACGLVLKQGGPSAVGCILPSDQLISPVPAFQCALADSITLAASSDQIVTLGVTPTRVESSFGFIECGPEASPTPANTPTATPTNTPAQTRFHAVLRFIEKPPREVRASLLAQGGSLWNAGIFVWKAAVMRQAYFASSPDLASLIDVFATSSDLQESIRRYYPYVRAISFDYAVMERVRNALVADCRFTWDDIDTWASLAHHFPQDTDNNTLVDRAKLVNATSNLVVNTQPDGHVIAVAGLQNVVVVHTEKGTLVCSQEELPNLKSLIRKVQPA